MFAKPADYVKATHRIWHVPGSASAIDMPVIE
jgi:predicted acyl esterase